MCLSDHSGIDLGHLTAYLIIVCNFECSRYHLTCLKEFESLQYATSENIKHLDSITHFTKYSK